MAVLLVAVFALGRASKTVPASPGLASPLAAPADAADTRAPSETGSGRCPGADTAPSRLGRSATYAALLCLTNFEREAVGVPALSLVERLSRAEQGHVEDMYDRNYFEHEAPEPAPNGRSPSDRVNRQGYRDWQITGENIAVGYATARSVIRGWIKSAGHCKNMFYAGFTQIGFGVSARIPAKYRGGPYWGQQFATPQSAGELKDEPKISCPREPNPQQPRG